jgi:hypothetical protein
MTQPLPKTYRTIRWANDMDPNGNDTASDLESLEQDVMHIIAQKLGSNMDDPTRGAGALSYLGATEVQFATLPSTIDAQLESDPRITSSQTPAPVLQEDGVTYLLTVNITVAGQVLSFSYVLGPNGLSRA